MSGIQKCRVMGAPAPGSQAFCDHSLPLADEPYLIPTPPPHPAWPSRERHPFQEVDPGGRDFKVNMGGRESRGSHPAHLHTPTEPTGLLPGAALAASWHPHTKPSKGSHKQKAGAKKGGRVTGTETPVP